MQNLVEVVENACFLTALCYFLCVFVHILTQSVALFWMVLGCTLSYSPHR